MRSLTLSKIVGDAPCPACVAKGNDKTGNHLLIFNNDEGDTYAKCTRSSCGHYISPNEYDPSINVPTVRTPKSAEQAAAELEEVQECEITELATRNIKEHVAHRYGVRTGCSATDNTKIACHLYPKVANGDDGKITGYKVRNLDPKFFYSLGHSFKGKTSDPFGLQQAMQADVGGHYLWITEDELSAMSSYQVLDEYSKTTNKPAVISLPDGTGSITKVLAEHLDWINTFKNVVFVMDTDEQGQKAVEAGLKIIPHAQVVELPKLPDKNATDPNDYLMAGKGRDLFNMLLFKQEAPKIEGLVSIMDCLDDALTKPEYGISYPWPEFNDLTFGQRAGEIVGVGGGVGCGKTLIAHEVAAWNWSQHQQASFLVMLEENNGDTVKNVAGKVDGVPYHRPDFDFDVEKLRGTATQLNDGIHLWKSNINQNVRFDIDKIVSAIRYHAVVNDVKHVMLDNVTALTQHLSPTEINTEVGRVASTLAGLADELDLQIFIFSHLNSPTSGASHEEGGQVKEFQFTGSRALMRWCQVIIGFERDKMAEDESKHRSKIRLLKHRKYGNTGVIETIYTPTTGRLLQYDPDKHEPSVKSEEF